LVFKWSSRVLATVICVLFASGCDESLPPRSDPQNFLQASVASPYDYATFKDSSILPPSGKIVASLKNLYDDVLEKEADIQVTINIWMADAPQNRRTLRLTAYSLSHPALNGNQLTLLPRDSAQFVAVWNQCTDSGIPFWSLVPKTWGELPGGERFQQSAPIEFVAQASIRVFKNVQPRVSPPTHFRIIFQLFWSTNGPG
jgi:hypothetical protein